MQSCDKNQTYTLYHGAEIYLEETVCVTTILANMKTILTCYTKQAGYHDLMK